MKKANAITELDGLIFSQSMFSGCCWMMEREKQLDDINVFPVPDSDTGTNMSATLRQVRTMLEDFHEPSVAKAAAAIAETAIMESRGNSGAILSQFLQGFAEAIEHYSVIDTKTFSNAVMEASHLAYQAVSVPQEGTILTVMREWSQYVYQLAKNNPYFYQIIPKSLPFAEEVLQKTKQQMEVLKKADVVDAGAQGFVYLLEGIVDYIQRGFTSRSIWKNTETESGQLSQNQTSSQKYRFIFECLLLGKTLNHSLIRDDLEKLGSSCVIAGSKQKIRIILHTDRPDFVVKSLRNFGEIQQEKIEDVFQQNRDIYNEGISKIAIVTDTSCDLPDEDIVKYNIHKVPFRLHIGKESYLDEFTINDDAFYDILINTKQMAKTSQPSQGDFANVYNWTSKYFEKTLSIHLARPLSACEQAARQTAAKYPENTIHVVDSKTASVGMGLLVLYAAKLIEKELPWEKVIHQVERLRSKIKIYFVVNDVNYLIKGGRLSAKKGALAKLLNIKPILVLDENGAIVPKEKAIGIHLANKKVFRLIESDLNSDSTYWAGVIYTKQIKKAEQYKKELVKIVNTDTIISCKLSPTLGAHTGPDVMGIAIMELDEKDLALIK